MKTLIFDFKNLSGNDKAMREVVRLFGRANAQVVSSDVEKTTQRRAGVTFRVISFTFADGQRVTMAIKDTGDVFEVKINDKVTPLRHQDDHAKAVSEIADLMDSRRGAFQKKLALVRLPLPPSIKISRPNMLAALVAKRDVLVGAVAEATATLAGLTPSPG
jgi:Defence against restriction A N-terminal